MAANFVQGTTNTFQVVAPHAVTSGRVVVVGVNLFGVAASNADSAALVALSRGGVWTFPKANAVSTSAVAGAIAYWNNTDSIVGVSATSNTKIGVYALPVSNTDTVATVIMNDTAL
jgi:predicted RecA/RadA family phage recombinase